MSRRRSEDESSLLRQPDLGGGQVDEAARPPGTAPVGRFAGEGGEPLTGASGPWPTRPGEAAAACEDGFPGDEAVRRADAVDAGVFPGEGEQSRGKGPERRGALYDGPERRKQQEDWGRWRDADRRGRPFDYPSHQRS